MHSSLLKWSGRPLKNSKYRSQDSKNRSSGELSSRLFGTYKHSIRPNGWHIYSSASEMAMVTMCHCPSKRHGLSHWKCVLRCCGKCPGISMPRQETNTDAKNTCSTIRFHVYRNVSRCNDHGIRPYE